MAHLNKIHVTSTTRLSLNERFTAIAENRKRSRSLSRNNQPRNIVPVPVQQQVNSNIASANRRLLLQLERRHLMLAAMKVKRRNLRAPTTGALLKRGTVKALRVGANGKPIKANTLAKVATMNADLISNVRHRRSLRRTTTIAPVAPVAKRLGIYRGQSVGGAAERIAKRRIASLRTQLKRNGSINAQPRISRSRSRGRNPINNNFSGVKRSISRGRSISSGRSMSRGRSQSGGQRQRWGRPFINRNMRGGRRGRSMSRNRFQVIENQNVLPAKARLGIRKVSYPNRMKRDRGVGGRRNIKQGRIQKRPETTPNRNGAGGSKIGTRGRSRSRTRKDQKKQLQQAPGTRNARSRSRGRKREFKNGNTNGIKNGQQVKQQQQRRGRSRSRRDSQNLGKNTEKVPNKDDLDKELDQYMATTKTENDMGFLLRN